MGKTLRVTIINRSDATGGAAVVTTRLLEALRGAGVDARMLVAEKLTDNPHIQLAASPLHLKASFLTERLGIFCQNGFDRATLFKMDTGATGMPLWRHPWVREADVVMLGWVNQGLLSLEGLREIIRLGKPVVWTMHDLWCATGICHHPGACDLFMLGCRDCPLLGKRGGRKDLSYRISRKKERCYDYSRMAFVAVSSWAARRSRASRLLRPARIETIPNAFPLEDFYFSEDEKPREGLRIAIGAARLDDPIKGMPILLKALRRLSERGNVDAHEVELVTFGDLRNPDLFSALPVKHRHMGRIADKEALRRLYAGSHVVLSTSLYETLPGTLIEGMACGCVPVALENGGQADIITAGETGFLLPFPGKIENPASAAEGDYEVDEAAERIAMGIEWAATAQSPQMRQRMREAVATRFSSEAVAQAYIQLFTSFCDLS